MAGTNDTDSVIRRILEAEEEVAAAVAACERLAAEREARAREQARRIAARTDERIRRLQNHPAETSAAVAATPQQHEGTLSAAQLEEAAEALVAELLADG